MMTGDTPIKETNENCIDSVEGFTANTDTEIRETKSFSVSTPKRKVRYPGDINENIEMSPNTMRNNFRLCKNKIKMQAKENYQLKQKVKRQQKQIQTLKGLLRKLKNSFGLSGQAVQSIESTFEDDIIDHIAKQHNVNTKKQYLRSKCTKLVHFTHQ